jgi:methyl coenzyme M reductase alpha subunit
MFEISYPAIVAISAFLVALGVVAGFWSKFSDRMTRAQAVADTADKKVESASLSLLAQKLEIDRLQREFSSYQITAAQQFVTDTELSMVEHRISVSVEEIKNDIRGVNSRLDRVLDGRERTGDN